jgi:beta-N-acetylhexosaminidase
LKLKLYGNFLPTQVIPNEAALQVIPPDDEISFTISRNSVTLVNPAQADLDQILPDPPNRTERIVFITDSRDVTQCSTCPVTPVLGVNALEEQIIHRYGPNAGRLVTTKNLSSFSIQDLEGLLNDLEGSYELERKLGLAHWIVFSMLDNSDEFPSYTTLSRFLAKRPALIQGKKVIVFAFNAPYYLDSTDISKLTAFYALYNKTNEALDVAAYVLFRELPATGSLPVSVPGVNYSLNDALFPDPEQVIPLELDLPLIEANEPGKTTTPPPPPVFDIGSIVPLKTGTILDHNGRPVPDGTPVEFTLEYLNEPPLIRQIEYTVQGVATTSFVINAGGTVEFIAQSEQAVSQPLQIEVPIPNEETPMPTSTPEPSPTPTLTPTETITPSPTATLLEVEQKNPGFPDWLIALIIAIITSWVGYRLVIAAGLGPWGIRTAALIMIGSLSAYTYLALGFPGSQQIMASSVGAGVVMCTVFGAGLGLLAAFTWRKMEQVTK